MLYLAGGFDDGEIKWEITANGSEDMPVLFSYHGETDTQIIVHVKYADAQFGGTSVKGTVIV